MARPHPTQPRRPGKSRARRRRKPRGAVAVEFILSLLILVFVLIGGLTFAHAMLVRYQLTNAAHAASRACSLAGDTTPGCADVVARQALQGYQEFCDPLQVAVADRVNLGNGVEGFQVALRCGYSQFPGAGFLRREALANGAPADPSTLTLLGQAVMPMP